MNNYFLGDIIKTKEGYWKNLQPEPLNSKNLVFVPEYEDYQVLGEIIEQNLPEYVNNTV